MEQVKFKTNSLTIMGALLLIVVLLFKTESSPIWQTNTWVDTNAMLTVGRSVLSGELPFRDFFEQRGPVLYGIYAIAATISSKNFLGVFIIEVIAMVATFYVFILLAKVFFRNNLLVVESAFLEECIVISSTSMQQGGSPEELVAPAIAYAGYVVIRYGLNINRYQLIILSALFSVVFWVKYSLIGIWVIYYLVYFAMKIFKRDRRGLCDFLIFSVLGFSLITLPIVLAYIHSGSLHYLISEYFVTNITGYASEDSGNMWKRILGTIIPNVKRHFILGTVIICTLMYKILFHGYTDDKRDRLKYGLLFVMILGQYFFMNIGGRTYDYYFMPIIVIGGLLTIVATGLLRVKNEKRLAGLMISGLGLLVIGSAVSAWRVGPYSTAEYIQTNIKAGQRFNKLINQLEKEKSSTNTLQFGGIDNGMYLATGKIIPQKYFNNPNFSYEQNPKILDSQFGYFKNKQVEFVITTPLNDEVLDYYLKHRNKAVKLKGCATLVPKVLDDNYTLIDKVASTNSKDEEFLLFHRKS